MISTGYGLLGEIDRMGHGPTSLLRRVNDLGKVVATVKIQHRDFDRSQQIGRIEGWLQEFARQDTEAD